MKKFIAGIITGGVVSTLTILAYWLFVLIFSFLGLGDIYEVLKPTFAIGIIISIAIGLYSASKFDDIGVIIVKVFKTSIIATLILCVIMSIVGASVEKSGRKSYSYIEKDGIRTYEKDYYFDYD